MEKIWLWSLVVGVVVLSGCGVLPQEEKVLSGDISQTRNETGLSPAEALSWKEAKLTLAEVQEQTGDTTPIVVITEANSGAIVTQTGDALIYSSSVGFDISRLPWTHIGLNLWKWKQSKVSFLLLSDQGISVLWISSSIYSIFITSKIVGILSASISIELSTFFSDKSLFFLSG